MSRWTIAVITAWDGESGDELFENVGTVEAGDAMGLASEDLLLEQGGVDAKS